MIANETVNRAIAYILNNITRDISVDVVSRYCNFSRHHFSRIFKTTTGESIYEFIKRVKMEQSAFRLKVEKGRTITDIGADYGYSSSNYSSAFKQHHDMSPAVFRRNISRTSMENPIFGDAHIQLESFAECSGKITIEQLKDCRVIYERRIGNYGDLSSDWCAFQEKYQAYITDDTVLLERTYDDPSITDTNECLYDICMSLPDGCDLPSTDTIKGGKFAIYHFKGLAAQIYAAYQSVFNVWLPQSGCEIDDRYGFEIYRKIGPAMYLEIDLCFPIK